MGEAAQHPAAAEELQQGDVIRILLEQHAQIRALCSDVVAAPDVDAKSMAFHELRGLLAVHEAAEQVVVRPRSRVTAGESVANDRDAEEKAAAKALVQLEEIPIDTHEFDAQFAAFAQSVTEHADAEEAQEFPRILIHYDAEERLRLGTLLTQAETLAPTHPHPSLAGSKTKQILLGPFASLLDRAKEALSPAVGIADERAEGSTR